GKVKSDVVNTMRKKNTHFDIVLYPANVQGDLCPIDVCAGIDYFMAKRDVDVIIIARGGGSYDELFCFNDERIARKVFECDIPVISAIGHDEDYTILDYVADFRAATPTGAGNCVIGSYSELSNDLNNLVLTLDMSIAQYLANKRARLDALRNHKALYSTETYFENQKVLVGQLKTSMNDSMVRNLTGLGNGLSGLKEQLETLNPSNVLKRGYSYVSDNSGNTIESVDKINKGDSISIVFADGKADATITSKNKEDN
nr:exodeoxyribonuclease VII large subunit [Saccharofermentans sp.]